MTERKARAKATANAGPSATLRFAQEDSICLGGEKKSKGECKSHSRFPAGMTERKARAKATANATAGLSATLRFAQDDNCFYLTASVIVL
jgi:hypothetical protein